MALLLCPFPGLRKTYAGEWRPVAHSGADRRKAAVKRASSARLDLSRLFAYIARMHRALSATTTTTLGMPGVSGART